MDSREGSPLEAAATEGQQWASFEPACGATEGPGSGPERFPRCVGFRLRFTSVADEREATDVDLAGVRLQVGV